MRERKHICEKEKIKRSADDDDDDDKSELVVMISFHFSSFS